MNTSIILSLDTRRAKKDGTFPLIFRLSHHSKTTSIKTGYWIKKSDWDKENRKIKSSFKGTESPKRLNIQLESRLAKYKDQIGKLFDKEELKFLSVKQLRDQLTGLGTSTTLYAFADTLINELIESNRVGTARTYRHAIKAIQNFRRGNDMSFREVNVTFLNDFEKWHLSKGNSLGGLSVYLRTLRAICRKAIQRGVAEEESYAFDKYTIRSGKPQKRAISIESIKRLGELELDRTTQLYRSRQLFMMSFMLNGMPFSDMAHLKVENIIDGRIKYARQKTNTPINVNIPELLWEWLKPQMEGKEQGEYIFEIIKRTNPVERYKDIEWARKRYNKHLKELAKRAGIEENLTSYVSRHSYASSADEMGVPLTVISQMLGHEKISTTQAYLNSLKSSALDSYQEQVLKKLQSNKD